MKDKELTKTNHVFRREQLKFMAEYKKETGTSASELLRNLLDEYKEKYDKKMAKT
jgi:hypothetical protein